MSENHTLHDPITPTLTVAEWLAIQDDIEDALIQAGVMPRDTSLERWAVEKGYITPTEMNAMPVAGYEFVGPLGETIRRWHLITRKQDITEAERKTLISKIVGWLR